MMSSLQNAIIMCVITFIAAIFSLLFLFYENKQARITELEPQIGDVEIVW